MFVCASIALACHTVSSVALRGSGEVSQQPIFIHSEIETGRKTPFPQINNKDDEEAVVQFVEDEDTQNSFIQYEISNTDIFLATCAIRNYLHDDYELAYETSTAMVKAAVEMGNPTAIWCLEKLKTISSAAVRLQWSDDPNAENIKNCIAQFNPQIGHQIVTESGYQSAPEDDETLELKKRRRKIFGPFTM